MSVNKCIILGHLGQDPELKHLPNGTPVVNVSVATTKTWNGSGWDATTTRWATGSWWGNGSNTGGERAGSVLMSLCNKCQQRSDNLYSQFLRTGKVEGYTPRNSSQARNLANHVAIRQERMIYNDNAKRRSTG